MTQKTKNLYPHNNLTELFPDKSYLLIVIMVYHDTYSHGVSYSICLSF